MEKKLLEMDLRELREAADKTQEELADALKKAQSEISRLENRSDYRFSTLQRYVAALGGELEVVASFGNRRIRLRAA
ncbi:MAG: helix-turn-helix domain-containing protein [Candidatus Binataceae bacterium]